ncbi:MAG: TlpA family protein disulfide reductase [Flavobacteriales bacterium]|nr:TlpA family protein disulfide reductase [Flavobacteriales bacterium]
MRSLSLILPVGSLFCTVLGCGHGQPGIHTITTPRIGPWRAVLQLDAASIPFLFQLDSAAGGWEWVVMNGAERIAVHDVTVRRDSMFVHMPLFDSSIKCRIEHDSLLVGEWCNNLKGPDYRIPFQARAGKAPRFAHATTEAADLSGTWETHFSPGKEDAYDALGMFEQHGDLLTGTFGTETGDYRFLEGVVREDSLFLSCFDGSHAFLFRAELRNDTLVGHFWSGSHWEEPWHAVRNDSFALRDQDSLTFLKEGYDMVDFRFPSIDGGQLSPKDERFTGKPLMVQIMGSWCPNCVDETRLLNEVYGRYHDQGLEVLAVAFEKYEQYERAIAALREFRDELGVEYPITYAGLASKSVAAEKLPFLDHVMSFPTTLFIDRLGKVRRIRTGFYGPGTGEHYAIYKRNLNHFLERLLSEAPPQQVAQGSSSLMSTATR